jgi:uncharacterized protein
MGGTAPRLARWVGAIVRHVVDGVLLSGVTAGEWWVMTDVSGTRLMIFLSEDDRSGHRGLHQALLDRARQDGMAGATVWRAVEGFGPSGRLRTARFPDVAGGLPLVVELIDQPERIEAFLAVVKELAPGSLVTREQVRMARRDAVAPPPPDDGAPAGLGAPAG